MPRWIALALALLVGLGLAVDPAAAQTKIKIGYILPLTGGGAEYGQRQLRGATLALEEINVQSAQTGFSIEMVTSDTKCVPVEAANAAERLVERDRIASMVGGTCSPEGLAALRVTRRLEVPHIVPTAAAVSITEEGNPFVFRTIPHNHHLAEHLADSLVDRLKLKRGRAMAPLVVKQIFEMIEQIHASGTTILLVEQNANLALRTASRGYVLQTGRVVLEGPTGALRENPMVRRAYLGKHAAAARA
jgi:hypothetical protein